MPYETALKRAMSDLRQAQSLIQEELRSYPTPVSGCDAQYNHLIGQRGAIALALSALETPPFVATPRMPVPGTAVESR